MSLSCEVCYEFYAEFPADRRPRALPFCGHDFCTRCIASLCTTEKRPVCPKCRVPFFHKEHPNSDKVTDPLTCNTLPTNPLCNPELQTQSDKHLGATKLVDTYLDWPVLRCLLQLDERMDFGSSTSPNSAAMNLLYRALQAAPTAFLQIELDQRKRRELLDQLPTDLLQQELLSRQRDEQPCGKVSFPTIQPSTTFPTNNIDREKAVPANNFPFPKVRPMDIISCTSAGCMRRRAHQKNPSIGRAHSAVSIDTTESGSHYHSRIKMHLHDSSPFQAPCHNHACCDPSLASSCKKQVPTVSLPEISSALTSCIYGPQHSPQPLFLAWPPMSFNQPNIVYNLNSDQTRPLLFHSAQYGEPNRRLRTGQIFFEHLFAVFVLLWHFSVGGIKGIGSLLSRIASLFNDIGREQQLQLFMIANAIPLLVGSFYIFYNPTFLVQFRSSTHAP